MNATSPLSSLEGPIRFGIITDLHFAPRAPEETRFYRQSLAKLRLAVGALVHRRATFLVELGDLVDSAETVRDELAHLKEIDALLQSFPGGCYHVLGNHCLASWTKGEFLALCQEREMLPVEPELGAVRMVDHAWLRLILLDGNFRPDGIPYACGHFDWTESYVPPAQIAWLRRAIRSAAGRPVVVMIHQNLHLPPDDPHAIRNASAVREVLESAGNVLAVFQGHQHAGEVARRGNIPYYTLKAMVDGQGPAHFAAALVTVTPDATVIVEGLGRQPSLVT